LKVNLADLEEGGTIIVNTDGFTPENLKYANYASNPLEDGSLAGYRVHKLPISTLNMTRSKATLSFRGRRSIAAKTSLPSGCFTGFMTGRWRTR